MHHRMRKPRKLEVRRYAAHMIELNEYLVALPGVKSSDKLVVTELVGIILNSM